MSCAHHRSRLRDVAAGADPSPDVISHLRNCFDCRAALVEESRLLKRIDEGLRQGVAAVAGPDLPARVRERIAHEPSGMASPIPSWRVSLVAGLAALVAVLFFARRTDPRRPPPAPSALTAAPRPAPDLESDQRPTPRSPRSAGVPPARIRLRPSVLPEPEVLVSAGERAALDLFLAGLARRRVDASSLVVAEPSREANEISIESIEVKPLETSGPAAEPAK